MESRRRGKLALTASEVMVSRWGPRTRRMFASARISSATTCPGFADIPVASTAHSASVMGWAAWGKEALCLDSVAQVPVSWLECLLAVHRPVTELVLEPRHVPNLPLCIDMSRHLQRHKRSKQACQMLFFSLQAGFGLGNPPFRDLTHLLTKSSDKQTSAGHVSHFVAGCFPRAARAVQACQGSQKKIQRTLG